MSTLSLLPGDLGTKLVLDQVADKQEVGYDDNDDDDDDNDDDGGAGHQAGSRSSGGQARGF